MKSGQKLRKILVETSELNSVCGEIDNSVKTFRSTLEVLRDSMYKKAAKQSKRDSVMELNPVFRVIDIKGRCVYDGDIEVVVEVCLSWDETAEELTERVEADEKAKMKAKVATE